MQKTRKDMGVKNSQNSRELPRPQKKLHYATHVKVVSERQ